MLLHGHTQVELCGVAGASLEGLSLEFYNGGGGGGGGNCGADRGEGDAGGGGSSTGTGGVDGVGNGCSSYGRVVPLVAKGFPTTLENQGGSGFGCVAVAPSAPLADGPINGVALVSDASVLEFVSFNGIFKATDGTAAGLVATNLDARQTPDKGGSLQLRGGPGWYTWIRSSVASWAQPNSGQFVCLSEIRGTPLATEKSARGCCDGCCSPLLLTGALLITPLTSHSKANTWETSG